jgi:hypothetical protein
MIQTKSLDLFAGIPVGTYTAAREWYQRLLGVPPIFFPHDTEAVWEVAGHRYLYIVQQPEHAGHTMHTLFVDDLDALVGQIANRGLDPVKRETYSNGVRKATYRDPDGTRSGSVALRFRKELMKEENTGWAKNVRRYTRSLHWIR